MAKGYAMERWNGKKGSNVFYKISNSNNAQKQGVRERTYEVSNPKTRSQALQRMKVRAAQNFYNTLAPILNRAQQGVKYGGMTRQQFMKYALSMTGSPAVEKGSNVAIPGNYLLSKGSLPAFTLDSFSGEVTASFSVPFSSSNPLELRSGDQITSEVLGNLTSNGALKENDQLTFILFDEKFNAFVSSFLIKVGVQLPTLGNATITFISGDDSLIAIEGEGKKAAVAIILSRKNGNKYERSTAYLALNDNVSEIQQAYSTEAINAALATYIKTVSASVGSIDWPVDPSTDTDEQLINAYFTLENLTGDKSQLNGRDVLVYEGVQSGDMKAVGVKEGVLVDFNSLEPLSYSSGSVGSIISPLLPTDVPSLATLPQHEI